MIRQDVSPDLQGRYEYLLEEKAKGCIYPGWPGSIDFEIALIERVSREEKELEQWKTWGVVEIAIRNPHVLSYMEHWEKRAIDAESRLKLLEDTQYLHELSKPSKNQKTDGGANGESDLYIDAETKGKNVQPKPARHSVFRRTP